MDTSLATAEAGAIGGTYAPGSIRPGLAPGVADAYAAQESAGAGGAGSSTGSESGSGSDADADAGAGTGEYTPGIPDFWDWREHGAVGPVKDQGT